MSTDQIQIYVPLLDEGTDVFRPALGVFVSPDVIRVLAPDGYDPDDEHWEFPPGSEVRCVAVLRSGRQILVARSRTLDLSPNA